MELRHVYGRTYAAVGATALMPVYKLTDTDIVLMDTGYAKLDRSARRLSLLSRSRAMNMLVGSLAPSICPSSMRQSPT